MSELKIKKIKDEKKESFTSREEELIALYVSYLDKIKDREGIKFEKKRVEVEKKLEKLQDPDGAVKKEKEEKAKAVIEEEKKEKEEKEKLKKENEDLKAEVEKQKKTKK